MKVGIVAQPQVDYCLGWAGGHVMNSVAIYARSICTDALQVTKKY